MAHAPDYQFTYIEGLIQHLAIRGLWITPAEALEGVWVLEAAGIKDKDAETALWTFLTRLSPFHHGHLNPEVFPGWKVTANSVPATPAEMQEEYGSDAVRVAAVIKKQYT